MYLIVLILILFFLYYIYVSHKLNYWKKRNVYHEKPIPFFGNFMNVILRKNDVGSTLKKIYDKLDDGVPYYGLYIFHEPYLVLRNEEIIKNVLIKDFNYFVNRTGYVNESVDPLSGRVLFALKNDVWRGVRNKMSPVFTSGKLKMMLPLMNEVTNALETLLKQLENKEVNVTDITKRYAVDVISSCAFGINANSLKDENAEIKKMSDMLLDQRGFVRSFAVFSWIFCPLLVDIFRLPFIDRASSTFLVNVFKQSSAERKKTNTKRHDLIDLLNQILEQEKQNDSKDFDDTTAYAQALTFFNAGADGTSTMFSLALYELAINPDIQEKLRTEIRNNVDSSGYLSYEILFQLEYLDLVIKETLRKYPFTPTIDRYAENDYICPKTQLKIEKGTRIIVPLLALNYDPKYYPNPEKFDPERFKGDKMKNLQYIFLPFGDGARKCIGERFALMSIKIGLAMFIKNFEVTPGINTVIPIKFTKAATFLTPENGTVFLKIRSYQKC